MKIISLTALIVLTGSICGTAVCAAQGKANAWLSCSSVRMHRGTGNFSLYSLELSSTDPNLGSNGELGPYSANYALAAHFALHDPSGFDPMIGTLHVNVPARDNDNDGFGDFYESSEDGSGTSTGVFSIPGVISSGAVTARWTRAAGTASGTCLLTLQNLGDFTHAFELIEYKGVLNYQPGTGSVTGIVDLVQTGVPDQRLNGPVTFKKLSSDPYNRLLLNAGSWTNSLQQALFFTEEPFERDPQAWPTNYYGYVEFDTDGDRATFFPFALFLFSIDDLNDRDGDGVPDFSDDPGSGAIPPTLTIARVANQLHLGVHGQTGTSCALQTSTSPTADTWQTVSAFTLTNGTQVLQLPIPSAARVFWRVQVL